MVRLLLCLIAAYLFSTIIHECGHGIVAIFQGWKFDYLIIGPVKIYSQDKKVSVCIEKNIALWGGVCSTRPKERNEKNIKIFRRVLIAGPVASVLTGIIALIYAFSVSGLDDFLYDNIWSLFCFIYGVVSFSMGLMCILPFPIRTGFLYVDGYRWLRLLKNNKEEITIFKLQENEILKNGDITYEEINVLIESDADLIKYMGYCYAIDYYRTNDDYEKVEYYDLLKKEMEKKIPKALHDSNK